MPIFRNFGVYLHAKNSFLTFIFNIHNITFIPSFLTFLKYYPQKKKSTSVPKVLEAILILICMQKINLSLSSFWRYCTDIVHLLFWELQKCLTISIKIIVSICSELACLPACKKSTSSFTSLLRYCREIANFFFVCNLGMTCHTHQK